ncbi:unnamed protein product [Orchesella dallaii]
MKYVKKNTILKFRTISSLTRNAVDKTLQSFSDSDDEDPFDRHCSHYEESSSKRYLRSVASSISCSYMFTLSDFGYLLDKVYPDLSVASSDVNPFLVRYISYFSDFRLGNDPHVLNILPKFGHHLLTLNCFIVGDSSTQPFHNIVAQLRLVPNIKRLWIRPQLWPRTPTDDELDLTGLSTTVYEFPALPKLVILDVRLVNSNVLLDTVVLAMLRHYSKQLICFTCDAKLFLLQELNVDVLNLMFPNVKKFHLLGKGSDFATGLEKLSNVSWPLERLHLEVHDGDQINPQNVISTISNFHENLEHLKVDCLLLPKQLEANNCNENEAEEKVVRKMSKLKIVRAKANILDSNLFCKFLKDNCPHLEELYIETSDILCRERGRWALDNLRNLEKVVLGSLKSLPVNFHTMRRPVPNETL